jgi:hypothetical protein
MEDGGMRLRVIWRGSRQSTIDQLATDMQPEVVLIGYHRRLIPQNIGALGVTR